METAEKRKAEIERKCSVLFFSGFRRADKSVLLMQLN